MKSSLRYVPHYSLSLIAIFALGLITHWHFLDLEAKSFDEVSDSLVSDLKEEYGTNIVVGKIGKDIHLSFPYGRSNFVYVINVENYYQLFEP